MAVFWLSSRRGGGAGGGPFRRTQPRLYRNPRADRGAHRVPLHHPREPCRAGKRGARADCPAGSGKGRVLAQRGRGSDVAPSAARPLATGGRRAVLFHGAASQRHRLSERRRARLYRKGGGWPSSSAPSLLTLWSAVSPPSRNADGRRRPWSLPWARRSPWPRPAGCCRGGRCHGRPPHICAPAPRRSERRRIR